MITDIIKVCPINSILLSSQQLAKKLRKLLFYFLLLLVSGTLLTSAGKRPFPRKLIGIYHGIQESYEVPQGDTSFVVPASRISIKLSYSEMLIQTPQRAIQARFEISAPTKKYYALKVFTEDGIIEEWLLHKRPRKLTRKAHAPRPETIFLKGK
jgi:hypothetical protein